MNGMGGRLRSLRGAVLTAAVLPVIAILVESFGSASQQRVAIGFFINLVVVVGLQMFTGNSGVVNLGHVSFMGIGAYVTAILATPPVIKQTVIPDAPLGLNEVELGVVPVVLVAMVVTGVIAWVSGVAITRQVGIAATITSLAFLVIVHTVLVDWEELTRGARAFHGIPLKTTLTSAMLVAAVAVVFARLFRDSTLGLQLRAGGEDPLAAASMGVHIRRLRLLAWVLGSVLIGMGGVLYAFFLGTISPSAFYFQATFLTLAMLLLGGMRSVSGAVTGAIFVTLGVEFMRHLETGPTIGWVDLPTMSGLTGFFLGAVIVLVMTLRPNGLVGDDEIDETVARGVAGIRAWRQRGELEALAEPSGPAVPVSVAPRELGDESGNHEGEGRDMGSPAGGDSRVDTGGKA